MRKKISVIFLLLLSLMMVKAVHADNDYSLIINDEEDLLTASEEESLKHEMEKILPYGNAAFVTVSQYDDTDVYTKNTYRELFGTESGILFVIDMGRRNIWIFCDGAIYRTINKSYSYTITDNAYRYASNGDYYDCAEIVFEQSYTLLEGGRISQPMKYISNVFIALVIALLVNFSVLLHQRGSDVDSSETIVAAMTSAVGVNILSKQITKSQKHVHVESSDDGGSYGGGSSGGGGGGGSSGGGGGHSF